MQEAVLAQAVREEFERFMKEMDESDKARFD